MASSQNYVSGGDIACFLVVQGADPNKKSKRSQTALIIATLNGHTGVVEALVRSSANVNNKDRNGNTALMHAVQHPRSFKVLEAPKKILT
jgi:ankyrin repeat protein